MSAVVHTWNPSFPRGKCEAVQNNAVGSPTQSKRQKTSSAAEGLPKCMASWPQSPALRRLILFFPTWMFRLESSVQAFCPDPRRKPPSSSLIGMIALGLLLLIIELFSPASFYWNIIRNGYNILKNKINKKERTEKERRKRKGGKGAVWGITWLFSPDDRDGKPQG